MPGPPSDQPAHIVYPCPACGTRHTLRGRLAGKAVRCPACGRTFRVPVPRGAAGGPGPVERRKEGRAKGSLPKGAPGFDPFADVFEEPPEGEPEP